MNANDLSASYQHARHVTQDDAADLPGGIAKALYIGVAGTLKVNLADGTTFTFATNIPVGILPLKVKRVWDTGTLATDIVALY
jgi:hypothetical protein